MRLAHRPVWLGPRAGRAVTFAALVALLYAGRDVLIPLVSAVMLSLLLAPVVRALETLRLGRGAAVAISVLGISLAAVAGGTLVGREALHLAQLAPELQANFAAKIQPFQRMLGLPGGLVLPSMSWPDLLRAAGATVESGAILLLVLTFVLFERESLRDRFIRILGAQDIHRTTVALDDASARLSRYFLSQFIVNCAFGACVALVLRWLQHPEALLCGALAAGLRFLPYFGIGLAAAIATGLAVALDPGWNLTLGSLGAILGIDFAIAQLLEPHLYGHATGLSPLSVVLSAIFWSCLWGPPGLLLSTPLTVCVLVAGRHIESLRVLELLLGNAPPLTLPQSFYQRALAGDTHEILTTARLFLKEHDLVSYFDQVLLPAMHLASRDEARMSASDGRRPGTVRRVVLEVATALLPDAQPARRLRSQRTILDETGPGRLLRSDRERLAGRWQGPVGVAVPARSVQLCLSLGSEADDLAAELLARLLRARGVDARHFGVAELSVGLPAEASPNGTSIVYLVSAFPSPARASAGAALESIHRLLPAVDVLNVFCRGAHLDADSRQLGAPATTDSLAHALSIGLARTRA